MSHAIRAIPARAPRSCATMNIGTSSGAMPAKVAVNARAIVTAGFANEVEAVNQYASMLHSEIVPHRHTSGRSTSMRANHRPQCSLVAGRARLRKVTPCACERRHEGQVRTAGVLVGLARIRFAG